MPKKRNKPHASVLTIERYLECNQKLEEPVNDQFGALFN
jgi:hypothetical protein